MAGTQSAATRTIKILSLLVICYGNIFHSLTTGMAPGPLMGGWWALADIGLFYLAMSSAYRTALRYETPCSMKHYWPQKFGGIGAQVLFINALLFCWFLIQGKDGLFTAYTLANILGLNGFLSWFHLGGVSPFGAGQWFITLLLLFYLAYPLINRYCASPATTAFTLIAFGHAAMAGEFLFHHGHPLWSTSFGFVAGFYLCRNKPPLRKAFLSAGGTVLGLAVFKLLGGGSSVTTYVIIAMLGFLLGLLTLPKDIPQLALNSLLRPLDAALLPLLLLHTYFFEYAFVAQPHLNALIVLACNVALAKIVSAAYAPFRKILFSRSPAVTAGW